MERGRAARGGGEKGGMKGDEVKKKGKKNALGTAATTTSVKY